MTKEEILDIEYKKYISQIGVESIYTPHFPVAFIKPALKAMQEYSDQETAALKAELKEAEVWEDSSIMWEAKYNALKAENESTMELIKSLYVLYNRIEQHWQQFKTENNL